MKTLEKFKIVQELMYQRSHRKMKRVIKKRLRDLEQKWEVSNFNVA